MNREVHLEDEWYQVRYSGEIPEVALHSSIHFLTEDPEGPRLQLEKEDYARLHDAVETRYLEIILRDITPENRDKPLYRGVLRTISNWRRYKRFCARHHLPTQSVRAELRVQLPRFLQREIEDVSAGMRQSCINCTYEDLNSLAVELDLSLADLEADLRPLCLDF